MVPIFEHLFLSCLRLKHGVLKHLPWEYTIAFGKLLNYSAMRNLVLVTWPFLSTYV